jgi:HPt (histidine-containing phosphotransfer) domain-containing protein
MAESPDHRAAVDEAQLMLNMAGSREILAEAGLLFLDEVGVMVASLRAAISSTDPARIERAAHLIKGALLSMAASPAVEAAAAIEAAGRSGVSVPPDALDALEREIGRVRVVLGEILERGSPVA